jgi:cyclopropane fatty-acyl-phospholipid synthase-like methyltransferase
MHTKRAMAGHILKAYKKSGWKVAIFVIIRYLVCPWQKVIDRLIPLMGEGNLLDIGCGHGLLLHLVQIEKKDQTSIGIDHDPFKIAIARQSAANSHSIIFLNSGQKQQIENQSVSCITLVDVLYAVTPKDWPHIWELVHAKLKSNGVLLLKETVNTPKFKYWICLLQEIVATKILKYTKGQFPFLPSYHYYVKELTQNGFDVIEHQRIDQGYLWPHYLFIAKRKP